MKLPEIIGVSGTFGSGKDSLSHYLVEQYGYTHVSTSDLVREEAMRLRGSVERPVLYEVAQLSREKFGAGYFVELGLDKPRPLVISGIRSLGEMKAIKTAGGVMVFVDAPVELRFERMMRRARDDEAKISLDDFIAREAKELYAGDRDSDFNLQAIGKQADSYLENNGTLEEFVVKLQKALDQLALQSNTEV